MDSPNRQAGITRLSAMFILKTRDGGRLTQSATNEIVSGVSELFQHTLESVCQNTLQTLKQIDAGEQIVTAVQESIMSHPDPFKGLETEYLQNVYYRDNFFLIVRYIYRYIKDSYSGRGGGKPET